MVSSALVLQGFAAILTSVVAQTSTSCNPLKTTCPADTALGKAVLYDFTKGPSSDWSLSTGSFPTFGTSGAEFTIAKKLDSPTLTLNRYIMFGHYDIVLRAAPGQGVISSVVLLSNDLDEIDFEQLGAEDDNIQSNYFGKGNTTTYDRERNVPVATPHEVFHTYSVDWTANAITWSIDGKLLRTLTPQTSDFNQYPQTPMRLSLCAWPSGDPSEPQGVIQWGGGLIDYSKGPYTMTVQSVKIIDYSNGTSYSYADNSGDWQSIKASGGKVNSSGNPNAPLSTASMGRFSTSTSKPTSTPTSSRSTTTTRVISSTSASQATRSSSPSAAASITTHAQAAATSLGSVETSKTIISSTSSASTRTANPASAKSSQSSVVKPSSLSNSASISSLGSTVKAVSLTSIKPDISSNPTIPVSTSHVTSTAMGFKTSFSTGVKATTSTTSKSSVSIPTGIQSPVPSNQKTASSTGSKTSISSASKIYPSSSSKMSVSAGSHPFSTPSSAFSSHTSSLPVSPTSHIAVATSVTESKTRPLSTAATPITKPTSASSSCTTSQSKSPSPLGFTTIVTKAEPKTVPASAPESTHPAPTITDKPPKNGSGSSSFPLTASPPTFSSSTSGAKPPLSNPGTAHSSNSSPDSIPTPSSASSTTPPLASFAADIPPAIRSEIAQISSTRPVLADVLLQICVWIESLVHAAKP